MRRSLATIALFLTSTPAIAAAQLPLEVTSPSDGALLNDPTPRFAGTTAAGAEVTVSLGDDTPFTAFANDTGNWMVDAPIALEDGPYTAVTTATDGVEVADEVSVAFTIDLTPPALVVITPTDGSIVEATTEVSGNTDPDTRIDVFVDDVLVGTTDVSDGGGWAVVVPEEGELPPGTHDLTVTATDVAGNESTLDLTIAIEPPPDTSDTDGDGLFDEVERLIGTDPELADTDGDGLNDFEEFDRHETNPLATDTDHDGVDDAEEVARSSDPRLQDTDGGGVFDGVEFERGTSPTDRSDDYRPTPGETAGRGCATAPNGVGAWAMMLVVFLLFKRRRRR